MNLQGRKEANKRHQMRRMVLGRQLELEVLGILVKMKQAGQIDEYVQHPHYSKPDMQGCDFTIWKNGKKLSFGVTISMKFWADKKARHPDVPQFCWPLGTKNSTMVERIMALTEN